VSAPLGRGVEAALRAPDWVLLAVLALLPSLVSVWSIPLGAALLDASCAPDESAHMEQVAALFDGRTGVWPERPSRMSMYLPTPYAPHLSGLAVARAGADAPWMYRLPLTDETYRGYPLARLGSVVLGTLAVLALAAATAAATGSRDAGRFAGVIAALYPQRFFVASYVNNDVGTFAAGAFLALALARWLRDGEGTFGLPLVGVACGAVLLAKPSGYVLLPPTACWVAWAVIHGRVPMREVARAGLIAIAIATPLLVWNAVRNGGLDPLGIGTYRRFVASDDWHGLVLPEHAPFLFLRALARSSFMKFSNMSLAIPGWLYAPWLVSVPIGLWLGLRRLGGAPASARRAMAWIASTAVLGLAAMVYECFWIDFSPQGRYVLLPIVILTLAAWLAATSGGDRVARRRWAIGYLAVVALWSLWLLIEAPCGPGIALPEPHP
jgi:4-amino-4-deoxy-L-arabinose transferase-like glycosyltransferase